MKRIAKLVSILRNFRGDASGVAMTEAIVAVPFLVIMAAGVLEMSSIFWQRQQIEAGLRDSVRYMARCRHGVSASLPSSTNCLTVARNLAYHGNSAGNGPLRVPSWNAANSIITYTKTTLASGQINIEAETTHTLVASPFFLWMFEGTWDIRANYEQREIGW
ncbi:MAG: TadE/TadG family type IV pilus assembly protein [Rhizobiaceae bacterium]